MLYLSYLLIVILLVFLDQFVKYLIVSHFALYDSTQIIGNFLHLTYIQNYGAGFSIFQNQRLLLSIVAIVAIIVLLYLLVTSKKDELINKACYLLLIGGSIGNLIDRIRLGYVIDFLDFNIFGYNFPIFNIADCFITVGCLIIVFIVLKENKNAKN